MRTTYTSRTVAQLKADGLISNGKVVKAIQTAAERSHPLPIIVAHHNSKLVYVGKDVITSLFEYANPIPYMQRRIEETELSIIWIEQTPNGKLDSEELANYLSCFKEN